MYCGMRAGWLARITEDTMARNISNSDDIIDSRDILERIKALEDELSSVTCPKCGGEKEESTECSQCGDDGTVDLSTPETTQSEADEAAMLDEYEELATLRALVEEIDQNAGDSARDGVGLIRDSYFETYARELADDIGAINGDAGWPNNCIDWGRAADELRMDYSSVEFDGITYWVRL